MKSSLWIAATAIALSACGGGGGGDGGLGLTPPPAPAPAPAPPAPAPAPAPATRTLSYQAVAPSPSFLSQLNAEGANGWRYISGIVYTSGVNMDLSVLFAKSENTTYSYELPANADSATALQQQLNAQGARGFAYSGPDTRGAIYRKNNGSASTYSYRVLAQPANDTIAGLLAQDKAQGADGYYHLGSSLIVGGETVRIFEKDSQSNAKYDVEVLPSASSDADFMAQLDAQGARGFRFKSDYVFGSEGLRAIYEKDTAQSATFSYAALASPPNAGDLVTQANAQGANGTVLIGDLGLPSNAIKTLYVTPSACSGLLCDARSGFGF